MLSQELEAGIRRAVEQRDCAVQVLLDRYPSLDSLPSKYRAITEIDDVEELAKLIAGRDFTSREVTEAYCHRAALAQVNTNALTVVAFETAFARADELDDYLAEHGKTFGPLHGIPISLKDAYDLAGFDSSIGYASWLERPKSRNAACVDAFLAAGAVIYCKTNSPQAMKWGETNNFVYGLTTNPINNQFSPGGSSGGEGALLSFKGGIVGMGTDMGGSVRMPGSACGLFSFRPTARRLSNIGVTNCMDGLGSLESTIGPMSRSLSGIEILLRTLANAPLRDAGLVPMPWREFDTSIDEKLVFAYQPFDGVVHPHPPILRALAQVKHLLLATGHEVVDLPPLKHTEIIRNFDAYMQLDRGSDHASATMGTDEPIFPGNLSEFEPNHEQLSGTEIMAMNSVRDRIRQEYFDHVAAHKGFSGRSIDCILAPAMAHTAFKHGQMRYYGYTKVWNFLDYPCGTIPVTLVNALIDVRQQIDAVNALDGLNAEQYVPDDYDGLPVGIQIIGYRFKEEELLAAMKAVVRVLQTSQ